MGDHLAGRPRGGVPPAGRRPRPDRRAPAVASALEVRVDVVAGRVTLTGRLDARTAHLLHDGLAVLRCQEHTHWRVDVSGLTSIDDAGVRAVSAAYRRAVRHGYRITVEGVSPPLRDVLVLLRLDHHLLADPTNPGAGTRRPGGRDGQQPTGAPRPPEATGPSGARAPIPSPRTCS
ncbi:STAS domain-containing protein [Blastococcus sp. SYSU D00695]